MIMRRESTPDLVDQGVSGVPGGAASMHALERRLAPSVEHTAPHPRAMAYGRGVLSPAERKHSWPLVDVSGETPPDGFQHPRRRALWDPEAVRAARRTDLVPHLADPNAVLGLDETDVLHKGRHAAGVARQDRGTAGQGDHGQIGVCLGDAGPLGHALVARERYLPQAWTTDRDR